MAAKRVLQVIVISSLVVVVVLGSANSPIAKEAFTLAMEDFHLVKTELQNLLHRGVRFSEPTLEATRVAGKELILRVYQAATNTMVSVSMQVHKGSQELPGHMLRLLWEPAGREWGAAAIEYRLCMLAFWDTVDHAFTSFKALCRIVVLMEKFVAGYTTDVPAVAFILLLLAVAVYTTRRVLMGVLAAPTAAQMLADIPHRMIAALLAVRELLWILIPWMVMMLL